MFHTHISQLQIIVGIAIGHILHEYCETVVSRIVDMNTPVIRIYLELSGIVNIIHTIV